MDEQTIETGVVVKLYKRRVWVEKDIMGTVHIKMQHEGDEEFDFIQIQYDYRYTSNASQDALAKRILGILGMELAADARITAGTSHEASSALSASVQGCDPPQGAKDG